MSHSRTWNGFFRLFGGIKLQFGFLVRASACNRSLELWVQSHVWETEEIENRPEVNNNLLDGLWWICLCYQILQLKNQKPWIILEKKIILPFHLEAAYFSCKIAENTLKETITREYFQLHFLKYKTFLSACPMISLQVWQDKDPKQPFYNQQLPLPSPAGKHLHLCLSILFLLIGFVSLCLLKTIRESSNGSPSSLCWGWTPAKGQTVSKHPLSHTAFL